MTPEEILQRFEKQGSGKGFSMWPWNGQADEGGSSVSLHCGDAGPVPNRCVFYPPEDEGPTANRLLQAPALARVLRTMVMTWEPEWGVGTSQNYWSNFVKDHRADTFPGWMMYFSRRRGEVPALPAPVQVEPVEDRGTLVILTAERFSAAKPDHVQLATEVGEVLGHAGLFGDLRPCT